MPRQLTRLAHPETPERAALPGIDHRAGALAAAAADQLLILLGQTAPGAEQGALDDRPRHSQLLADLEVGETLELAQDEDPMVDIRHPPKRGAEVLQLLLALDGDVGARGAREQIVSLALG